MVKCRLLAFPLLAGLWLAVLGASAPAAIAQVGGAPPLPLSKGVIHHFESVPAGPPFTFVVNCPKGYIATGGSASTESNPAIRITVSVPGPGITGWTFTVVNTIGPPGPGRNVTAAVLVTCTKPGPAAPALPPKAMLGKGKALLSGPRGVPVVIPGLNGVKVPVTCPKGSAPVGETVKKVVAKGAQAASLGAVDAVQITRALPRGRTLEFEARNPSTEPQTVRLGAVCLRTRVKTVAGPRSIRVKTGLFELQVQPGDHPFAGRCRGGAILFAGFSLPADGSLSMLGLSPGRSAVTIELGNHLDLAQSAQVALQCVAGRTEFVKRRQG